MSWNPEPSYYTPPAADLAELRPVARPHAGLGIASFVIALLVGMGEAVLLGYSGYLAVSQPGTMKPDSPSAIILGLLMIAGAALAFLGTGLGLGGVFQTTRRRVFAVLGLVFNVLILTAFAGLVAIGLLAQKG